MAFLSTVNALRFPTIKNQLRTYSNPRDKATIQDGRVTVQQVRRAYRKGMHSAKEAKEHNMVQGENTASLIGIWSGTDDLDAFVSDCDEAPGAKAVLMANFSSNNSDVISEEDIRIGYIDTRPNGDALRKCILEGLYKLTSVTIPAVPTIDDTPTVPERTSVEILFIMSLENKAHYESEKEAIHLLLTRIGDEIYSTVDACKTDHGIWIAIERLQQGESLNIQDIKTNLFWEFGKFTSHDGESIESYYSRFYKMMNEMIRNNLTIATMQVNVQSNASTKFKGKEIAKPITPPSELASKEDNDPEQAQRDKDIQKNLALIAKYFKKLYKPTNKNLRTSSNSRNKNMDTTLRYKNDNQTRHFRNQRTVTVVGARETIGSQETKKGKKDYSYHKEKMLLCKQAEKGVPLQTEQADWLEDTDEEIDEQELEAHYGFMAKIQERHHSEQPESISNTCVVEMVDSNVIPDSPNMCDNDIQTDQNAKDEHVALANLIANLKLDVDENKKIQKQLKKANTSLAHEMKECKSILVETSRTLKESNSIRDNFLIALQNKQIELERYKTLNDRTVDFDKLKHKLNETLGLLDQKEIEIKEGLKLKAYEISVVKEKHDESVKHSLLTKSHYEGLVKEKTKVITNLKLEEEKDIDKMISIEKQLKFLNEIVYKRNQSIQTIHMLAPKGPTFNGRPIFTNPMSLRKAQSEKTCLYEIPYDQFDPANRLVPDMEETLTLEKESRSKLNKGLVRPYDYTKLNSLYENFKPAT
ncbi:hypothetical protein Tco_0771905 [Tanacetum coccineum]|uniref:Gag-Pol polyprotein n=1 Tax=Tanacetum coccineum TaxID=301880 RepID=A0ABQ4ZGF0_9ASTR